MLRVSDRNDWFELWLEDKECILNCMIRNLMADLDAGYDYFGNCAKKQRAEIDAYQKSIDDSLDNFKTMTEKQVNNWCFYDMVKRGAIA